MCFAVVVGLAAEARVAGRVGLRAIVVGGGPTRSLTLVERLVSEGVTGLVSFGICGGLDPALASARLVLPRVVCSGEGQRYPVDGAWRDALAAALRGVGMEIAEGDILGLDAIVSTRQDKASLFGKTAACAVDLESHIVAEAARKAGIPFIVLRVVADPAWRDLPAAALIPLDTQGRPVLRHVLRSLLSQPRQTPHLIRLAFETQRALSVLRRGARLFAS
jgi:adenosylhomocysteine nucleosidase